MKKNITGFALVIMLLVSVTSGCFVRNGHHYNNDHQNRDMHHGDH